MNEAGAIPADANQGGANQADTATRRPVVLITGGTRGLGAACARFLARAGWDVALTDLSDRACRVYGEIESVDGFIHGLSEQGNRVIFLAGDLTSEPEAERIVREAWDLFGGLDAVVTAAGGDITGDDPEAAGGKAPDNTAFVAHDHFMSIFNRNLMTCVFTCRAAGRRMRDAGRGKIVTVSSVSAGFGVTRETSYALAKAGVLHFTRCLAAELRPHGVTVNCVAPGATNTGRFRSTLKDRTPEDLIRLQGRGRLERIAEAEDVCRVIEFFLSPASDFVSGQVLRVDGGQFTTPL